MSARKRPERVVIEATEKRAFASAVDWPGWSRTAKTDEAAVAALADHAERYAVVAAEAGIPFAPGEYTVIERVRGTTTTDFGAPDVPGAAEREPLTSADASRTVALLEAAWAVLDRVVRGAPPSLRKGPRGGGRDRDAIVEHVLAAEHAYARKLGVKVPAAARGEKKAIATMRGAIVEVRAPLTRSSSAAGCPATRRDASPGTRSTTPGRSRTAARRVSQERLRT